MKKILRRAARATAPVLGLGIWALGSGSAWAAEGASKGGGLGLGAIIFLGLFALIILAQLLPGLVLFGSFLVALFTKARAKAGASAEAGQAGEPR